MVKIPVLHNGDTSHASFSTVCFRAAPRRAVAPQPERRGDQQPWLGVSENRKAVRY